MGKGSLKIDEVDFGNILRYSTRKRSVTFGDVVEWFTGNVLLLALGSVAFLILLHWMGVIK